MNRKPAAKLQAAPPPEDPTPEPPFAGEVKEFIRNLVIAEKNYELYPVHGKVVQQSLKSLHNSLHKFQEEAGSSLRLQVAQSDLVYEGKAVYHDENRAKSLAYRMYKDSVREVVFLEDIKINEIGDFLGCFKESRLSDEEDEFSTLFWEKDCTSIQIEVINDFFEEDGSENLPRVTAFDPDFEPTRFALSTQDEQDLRQAVEIHQLEKPEGDSTFELSELEIKQVQQFTAEEEEYFPLLDFVDILIELMARNHDAKAFAQVTLCIRILISSLIEQFDFERAASVLKRLSDERLGGLTDIHRYRIQELVKSFCDKPTMLIISEYLKENADLPKVHAVFEFMRALHRDAVPHFCELLKITQHIAALTEVLTALGQGWGDVFSQYLLNPDPLVARAAIQILIKAEKSSQPEWIAPALKHPLEVVRLQAAAALLELGDPKAGPLFIPLLSDRSKALVCFALQFFSRVPFPQASKSLAALSASRMFYELDSARKEQCFRALLVASPPSAIKFISRGVIGWGFCISNRAFQRKAAALSSLKAYPCEEGINILKKLASRRRRLTHTAQRTLKELGAVPVVVTEAEKETQSA